MIRIAICDDEKIFVDMLYSYLSSAFDKLKINVELFKYENAELLINAYKSNIFDVVFLDIDMPTQTGFDVANKIRELSLSTLIIFVSAKHELVYNSFEYNPFYFICKNSPNEMKTDIERVSEKLSLHFRQNKKTEISTGAETSAVVSLSDIIYIKSEKHYLLYYIKGQKIPLKERGILGTRETELENYDFVKPHRRYLINMNHISSFDTLLNSLVVDNDDVIPVSKGFKSAALEKYKMFKRR